VNIEQLQLALRASWSGETSSIWSSSNPARGQCSPSALVAKHLLGGSLLKTKVEGAWHFYNEINGQVQDFTAEQFLSAVQYSNLPATESEAFENCQNVQFEVLLSRVLKQFKS
jgi:hypothetical protein